MSHDPNTKIPLEFCHVSDKALRFTLTPDNADLLAGLLRERASEARKQDGVYVIIADESWEQPVKLYVHLATGQAAIPETATEMNKPKEKPWEDSY